VSRDLALDDIQRHLREARIDLWGVARNEPLLSPLAPALPTAISLVMRLHPSSLKGLDHGPTATYYYEYQRLNAGLDLAARSLAKKLRWAGHEAEAVEATIDDDDIVKDWGDAGVFPHKTAATQAGLGWIGKTALFVSPSLGPKVRLATVFTDLKLPAGTPITSGRCGSCRRCIDACPAGAGRDVQWRADLTRDDLYDEKACEHHLDGYEEFGGVCGICVAVCPYGLP
jgi:epoxyqueuosine reductase QueG